MRVEQNDYIWEEHMIESIKELDKNTPEGSIIDPDTLLADILDEADHEVSGLAREIFEIFKKSADKESVKELFFTFTGVKFDNFLNKCIKETSRKEAKIYTRNTQISYLYRDANNFKKYNKVILPGTFTDKQIQAIIGCLSDGEYFIPSEVGLPEDKYEGTDADHPWFELHEDDFSETDDDVTLNIKPEELVEKFLQRYLAWRNPCYIPSFQYCF